MKRKIFILILIGVASLLYLYKIIQAQSLLKEKKKLVIQLDTTASQRDQLQVQFAQIDLQLKEALNKVSPLQEELAKLHKGLEEKETYEVNLRKEIGQAQLDTYNSKTKLKDALEHLDKLNNELRLMKIEKASLEKINRKLQEDFSDITRQHKLSQEKSLNLEAKLTQTKNINTTLKNQVDELTIVIKDKEKALAGLNKDYTLVKDKLSASLKMQEELNKNWMDQLKKTEDKFSGSKKELSELKILKASLEKEAVDLNSRLSAISKANLYLEDQLSQLEKRNSSLENELTQINNQFQNQVKLNSDFENRIGELLQSLSDKEKDRLVLAKEVEEITRQRKNLEEEITNLKTVNLTKEQEVEGLTLRIGEVTNLYNQLKDRMAQLSEVLAQKELILDNQRKELLSLKNQIDKGDREKEFLQGRLSEKENEILQLQGTLNQTTARLEEIDRELTLAKERQKKMVEQLIQATTLNASFQERLIGLSRSLEIGPEQSQPDIEEQKRAEELERKVRVILYPGDSQ